MQIQNGITIQHSSYDSPQEIYAPDGALEDDVIQTDKFLRNPSLYAYSVLIFKPKENFEFDITGNYTGSMLVSKIDGNSGNFSVIETNPFLDTNVKLSYHLDLKEHLIISFSGGVQNIFQSYQDDFDSGPLRDSNYIYGPARPRTYFISLSISNNH